MPEYLAPGVFVEEVSYRAKSIEGVSTTTTGFIGPSRTGPIDVEPELLTSLVEFERVYGDGSPLHHVAVVSGAVAPAVTVPNYLWHAVRAFFENGGRRLYVQRVFTGLPGHLDGADGRAFDQISAPLSPPLSITVKARFPGAAGGGVVRIGLDLGTNTLAWTPGTAGSPSKSVAVPGTGRAVFRGLTDGDVVWVSYEPPPASPPDPTVTGLYRATATTIPTGTQWTFTDHTGKELKAGVLSVDVKDATKSSVVRVVTATVTIPGPDAASTRVWSGLALDAAHRSFGVPDSLQHRFAAHPDNPEWRRTVPIVIEAPQSGLALAAVLTDGAPTGASPQGLSVPLLLAHGNDGARPTPLAYEGDTADIDDKSGLKAFEDLEDISIVAAPGATQGFDEDRRSEAATIVQLLIGHAERMRYRIAVLDSGDGQSLAQVRSMRAGIDSKHAALYYPWVRVLDPITQQEIALPPSGFVAGIYARNDIQRAVHKAPANEVVTLALGFERTLNKAQQEVLNPEGINCFRYFEGRGNRLWGARTISSDPEWKYVNLRRYFAYLERSIDVGTQWAVFESNAPALWANVRRTISDFLFSEFVSGAFIGEKPETSYFVRCDRSTMTQNDIDNGRLVCLIGVAVVKPAEFVIFRVGQWTADKA